MRVLLAVAAVLMVAGTALAQDEAKRIKPEDLKWNPNPLLKGAEGAVVVGDPSKAGVVVVRAKFPANFKVPPHTHPYSEVVTVLSGSVGFGSGDKFDESKGEVLKVGGVNAVPAKQPHFLWAGSDGATVQIQFMGPTGFDFVNPADDPRKK